MSQHRTPAPDWQPAPVLPARIYLPKSDPSDIPGIHVLTETLEQYPAGSITNFKLVTDLDTMTPDRSYVIRLTNYEYVIRPFVRLDGEWLLMGYYEDAGQAPIEPIPLNEVSAVFVATHWNYLPYIPPHPIYLQGTSQLPADTSLTGRVGYVHDRSHLDCDIHVQVGDMSMLPLFQPDTYLFCNRTTVEVLEPGKCYVFCMPPHPYYNYALKRFDGWVDGALQVSNINPTNRPERPIKGVDAYRFAVTDLVEVYQIAGVYIPE